MFKLNHNVKVFLLILISFLLLISLTSNISSQNSTISEVLSENDEEIDYKSIYVKVKYREDPVDIGHPMFEYLDTSKSSFVRGAWYDKDNCYMVIKLKETYYQYCGMPSEIWTIFKKTDSFGTFYNTYIKGYYDCRINFVPAY